MATVVVIQRLEEKLACYESPQRLCASLIHAHTGPEGKISANVLTRIISQCHQDSSEMDTIIEACTEVHPTHSLFDPEPLTIPMGRRMASLILTG